METTLPELLERRGAFDGTPWLTVHEGKNTEVFTPARMRDLAQRWARALAMAGVRADDRVLVFLPNGADFIGAFVGAQILGATAVPVAWPFFFDSIERKAADLEPLIEVADPSAIVTNDRASRARGWSRPVVTAPATEPWAGPSPHAPTHSLSLSAHNADPAETCRETCPEEDHDDRLTADPSRASWLRPAFIQFTSGSTGRPRGAVISHRAAISSARAMGLALGLSPSDVGVSWLPLFHDMGLVGTVFCSLVNGFPLHLMTPSEFLLHPRRWLELATEVRATITVGPNFGYDVATRRIRDLRGLDLSRLRFALNGSEPVHRSTIGGFEGRFESAGLAVGTILPVYGLAENTLGVSFPTPGERLPDLGFGGRAVPSVGRPIAGTEVEIRDRGGRVVDEGDEGEIWVRGPALFSGYFRDQESTARALVEGWLATGDLGVVRDGCLYVTGREKELIIKGGQKFHPYEIESVVANAVAAPLNQVAAVSVPNDEKGTEDLAVVVELRDRSEASEADIQKLIRGRLMDALGVRAEQVHIVPPGTIPRTTSGKLRRRACADNLATLSQATSSEPSSSMTPRPTDDARERA